MRDIHLTGRQRQCLQARLAHMSAKETGRQLGISPHTVAMHWRLARVKLQSKSTLAAALRHRAGAHHRAAACRSTANANVPSKRDWLQLCAALALGAGALLSLLLLLALVSQLMIATLNLSFDKPYYNLFG
jgi:DNA-binding CsgD family transcriptional regulator